VTAHPALVAAAAEAGVTILAGTDSRPHGRVADEIRALAAAGLTPTQALAAASWAARAYLGLGTLTPGTLTPGTLTPGTPPPGTLTPGAPADAVIYDADPRTDLSVLDHPRAIILRGHPVRPH
jgi:imidazolonepropionase-like amidohydrolase